MPGSPERSCSASTPGWSRDGAGGEGRSWHFDFMGASRWFFTFSGVILIIGAVALSTKELNFGIDFESGTRITAALEKATAVVPAVPVVDTLIREDAGRVDALVDRVHISGVQTPQGFDKELLMRVHRHAQSRGYESSDDGSLVLALGETVTTIPGERTNIKVTYPDDVVIAEAVLGSQ